ncbi:ATP-binding cassette domain-containing protein [Texas Phoenix palm phytoplasma]|uniref:ATP-binding cassette domain-containing protein n=1 Tax=Texas Phoenix palm phytoplasma TaxID=176709 RepID=A0ABS5BIF8_9MOLU|nr:ATP-binding cassette domain-containing protein [Texas Phoenix palm phytoplasma]MBP3059360.1 ATP-binding cassette domain-containing protein [Texas Phoenix palm phytoplasma]
MFKIENINKKYINKKKFVINALNNLSLKLPSKGIIFILGKSGSGKTTLLNLLSGLDIVDSGNIFVYNNLITKFNNNKLDNYRNGMISLIFQESNLLEEINVLDKGAK